MRGLFITGTGTGVGKTYVGALIAQTLVAKGQRVGVYKPVASGCRSEGNRLVAEDAEQLWNAAGRPGTFEQVCPQRFAAPLAPPQAAGLEGTTVDQHLLRTGLKAWREDYDFVLIEGAGGLMSPLSEQDYNLDLAVDFGLPLLVVAANELGTINATLQTIITAQARAPQLPIAGIVLNRVTTDQQDVSTQTNAADIAARADAPLLAEVQYSQSTLDNADWLATAGR